MASKDERIKGHKRGIRRIKEAKMEDMQKIVDANEKLVKELKP